LWTTLFLAAGFYGGALCQKKWRGAKFLKGFLSMKKWIFLSVLFTPLAFCGCSHRTTVVYAAPPGAVDEIAQRGYHDGYEAARRDVAEQRAPDVKRHPKFRNPPVPPEAVQDYRHAFRAGYQAFLRQGPPPQGRAPEGAYPPPPPQSMN
jgi:hypothetical protein